MAERSGPQKALRKDGRPISADLQQKFQAHASKALELFLDGKNDLAFEEAMAALRIKPAPDLFAILASICEAKGDMTAASDFRLLHAFFKRDIVIWEELLQEFLSSQQFFKAALCLHRIALLSKSTTKRRELELQRAELLVGLGEIGKATTIYLSMWHKSNGKDFEVLAAMSSLFFQLGRLSALDRLTRNAIEALHCDEEKPSDDVRSRKGEPLTGGKAKRYLTLVNIRCELLIEQAKFGEAVCLVQEAARLCGLAVESLPPDLLIRLAVAFAYQGEKPQALSILKQLLLPPNTPKDFGDVLYDGAVALVRLGLAKATLDILHFLQQDESFRIPAIDFLFGKCYHQLGNLTESKKYFFKCLSAEKNHADSRVELSKIEVEQGNFAAAEAVLLTRPGDSGFDRIPLDFELQYVLMLQRKFVEAIEVSLPTCEILLAGEAGDGEESIAPGTAKRRRFRGALPSLVRTSSVLVPVTLLSQGAVSDVLPASLSVAASFRAGSSLGGVLARSTNGPLTSGSLAATARSGVGKDGGDRDTVGSIFRFKRSRLEKAKPSPKEEEAHGERENQGRSGSVGRLEDLEEMEDFLQNTEPTEAKELATVEGRRGSPAPEIRETTAAERKPEARKVQFNLESQEGKETGPMEGDSHTLPSLDEIAESFFDPNMALVFLNAVSGGQPSSEGKERDSTYKDTDGEPQRDTFQELKDLHMAQIAQRTAKREDVFDLLKHTGVVEMCRRTGECYRTLGQYLDGKEFCSIMSTSIGRSLKRREQLLVPLKLEMLRCAQHCTASEDSVRFAVDLLKLGQFERGNEIWGVLDSIVRRTKSGILTRLIEGGRRDPELLALQGNVYFVGGSHLLALKMYLLALVESDVAPTPPSDGVVGCKDSILCFQIGLCYLLTSNARMVRDRHACVLQAFAFLDRYRTLLQQQGSSSPLFEMIGLYQIGRAFHYLELHYLAQMQYERLLKMDFTPQDPQEQEVVLSYRRAAAVNLHSVFSSNPVMAKEYVRQWFPPLS